MKNYDNIRVYGDLESEVFLAPKGSTLPTIVTTDPASPFVAVGWLSEDGVDLTVSTEVKKFRAFQGGATTRTKVLHTEKSIRFQALEEKPQITEMYYGHGAPTVSGTAPNQVAKIDLPEGIGTVERAAVIKVKDGGVIKFICCSNVQVTDRGTLAHKNDSESLYEFTMELIGPAYILSNAPAYTGA